jgi:2,4-dichlorophenol 6-monooxygenase
METITTDVLIVGAGPAGLTAAALLARAGIEAITVTKYRTAISPRAHITNQRTMEVLRDLRIEDRVMARTMPYELMGKQVFATSFAGRELSRMMTWGSGDDRTGEYRAASPCQVTNIGQHVLEPILFDWARELGADIRTYHEVVALDDGPDRVIARVRSRDDEFEVSARYVIGCDGARTIVGREGAFEFDAQPSSGNAITVWIEADLSRHVRHRSGALFFVCNPGSDDVVSIWTCLSPWTEWSTIFVRHGLEPSELGEESVLERVRAAIGDPDVDVCIKHISPWELQNVVARSYRRGRLFLAGDAAHRHPPANGLGLNTSVQDAANLAWKLTLVLQGRAGDALLDSYDEERRPVGRHVVWRANQSVGEMVSWLGPIGLRPGQSVAEAEAVLDEIFGPDGEEQRQELLKGLDVMNGQFNAHGAELNQRYSSGAVAGDGTVFPEYERDPDLHYQPSTHPGCPLPHAWLARGTEDVSTLDLAAYDRFTLITGAGGAPWVDAAATVGTELGCEIRAFPVALGQEHNDVLGTWTRAREIGDRGCVLVRPDRFVGWRSHDTVDDPVTALRDAMTRILDRPEGVRR